MVKQDLIFGIWPHQLPPYFLQAMFQYAFSIYRDKIFIQDGMPDIEFINIIDSMKPSHLNELIGMYGDGHILKFVWKLKAPSKYRFRKILKINGKNYQIIRSGRYWPGE